jgi:RHS repeat-associated protein
MWIPEAGLYHYKARAYPPGLGRFLQTDPILYAGGMNLYAYVGNDPIDGIDPSGLTTIAVGIEGEATYGVGVAGGVGVAISFPFFGDTSARFDLGVYGFVSGRAGYLIGAGPAVGVSGGSVQDMRALTWDVTGGYGAYAATISGPITAGGAGPGEPSGGRQVGAIPGPPGARVRSTTLGGSAGVRATLSGSVRDLFSIGSRIFSTRRLISSDEIHTNSCVDGVCGTTGVTVINRVYEHQALALWNLISQGVLSMPDLVPGGFGALFMRQFLMTEGDRARQRLENMPQETMATSAR